MTIITVTLKTTTSTLTLDGSDFNDQVFGKSFKVRSDKKERKKYIFKSLSYKL